VECSSGVVLVVAGPVPGVGLAPFVGSVGCGGAWLSAPGGLSCERAVIGTIIVDTGIAQLFSGSGFGVCRSVGLFVGMNGGLTGAFFGGHGGLVVAETSFGFVACGPNMLRIAFLARSQVNDIFRFTIKNLRNRIHPASTSASKAIRFL